MYRHTALFLLAFIVLQGTLRSQCDPVGKSKLKGADDSTNLSAGISLQGRLDTNVDYDDHGEYEPAEYTSDGGVHRGTYGTIQMTPTEKALLSLTTNIFVWVEDDANTSSVEFNTKAKGILDFWTVCVPSSALDQYPPPGADLWTIKSKGIAKYNVRAPGDSRLDRTVGAEMVFHFPSGKTRTAEYKLEDGSTDSRSYEVTWVTQGGASQSMQVGGNVSNGAEGPSMGLNAAVDRQLQASVQLTRTERITLTGDPARSDPKTEVFEDEHEITTLCHGGHKKLEPAVEIHGNAQLKVKVNEDTEVFTLEGQFKATMEVEVAPKPIAECGPEPRDREPTGGTTPGPGGRTTEKPGGGTTPGGRGTGGPGKGGTTPPFSGGLAKGLAFFSVFIEEDEMALEEVLFFRVNPEHWHLVQFTGVARAIPVGKDMTSDEITFDPSQSLILTQGYWIVEVELSLEGQGEAGVEMSFEPEFPDDNTAEATLELIPMSFTLQDWTVGTHSSPDENERLVTVVSAADRVYLESLSPDVEFADLTLTYVIQGGDPIGWRTEPAVLLDEEGRAYVDAWSDGSCLLSIQVESGTGELLSFHLEVCVNDELVPHYGTGGGGADQDSGGGEGDGEGDQ